MYNTKYPTKYMCFLILYSTLGSGLFTTDVKMSTDMHLLAPLESVLNLMIMLIPTFVLPLTAKMMYLTSVTLSCLKQKWLRVSHEWMYSEILCDVHFQTDGKSTVMGNLQLFLTTYWTTRS